MSAQSPAEFPRLPDLTASVLPHLKSASVIGLCYLYDNLTPVADHLFSPLCRPLYGEFEDGLKTSEKTPYIVGDLLDKISEVREAAIDELEARPIPLAARAREYRARVLADWHFRSMGSSALESLDTPVGRL